MGRWTQYDEDSYRLPEGMKRVGYDSDTGRYQFRDQDGALWEGPQGAEFGEMRRVGNAPVAVDDHAQDDDEEAEIGVPSTRSDGYAPLASDANGWTYPRHTSRKDSAYRVILPFFLIVAAVLLLVFRLVHSSTPASPPETLHCPGSNEPYHVSRGDTCWALSQTRGCTVQDILDVNQGLNCEKLRPGQGICLPPSHSA
ncbi:uncharacterized protein TRAVEDRAFT_109915 [Trametes versicolor FP-101664 SS1]|uniref:uncharacterized protein n=1 Tax=Trametes versicolor (strain FP-101664) TaxID=717944 RepID=UPI0004623B4E|nr:uncharacterized protein TRAVEDRAFT_109915 [Trametes versicolor FP-101664 SS1]EIW63810.1 hypothetical protein TRAVEDRAFT_109915 [Trametes versicolor FP-101664 SS1]